MRIVIQTAFDFTPAGKRTVRNVQASRGRQLRGYVSGRRFAIFASAAAALEWRDNATNL